MQACSEFSCAIADVQWHEIKTYINECKFLSVIVDGSTDGSITDNEMVYLQSCKNGTVKTNFIRCCQVERGTAPAIVDAIERAVTTVLTMSDFIPELVAVGSYGASVMLGKIKVFLPY